MTRNIYQVVCRLMRKIKDMFKIKNIERSFMISEKKISKEEMSKSNAFWHILLAVQHENRKAWKMMNWLRFIYLCYWNMNLISLPILSYVVHSSDSLLKKNKQFNVAKIELWIKKCWTICYRKTVSRP